MTIDAARHFLPIDATDPGQLSDMAGGMTASRILVIAYAVKAHIAAGGVVADFTVGDFAPSQFAVPPSLVQHTIDALHAGQTNYPPADGVPELRKAIRDHYARQLGLDYPVSSVVVGSGARPVLYALYRCLVNPGEKVLTPAPSWNNKNFCQLVGAQHVAVPARPEDGFMPTAAVLAPYIKDARLLVLNSPMNPAGTVFSKAQLIDLSDLVLAENARRIAAGERLLYVIYDHVYRMLAFGNAQHHTPVEVRPEMAAYTLFADAISKGFAATGLRVGWLVAPPAIAERVKSLMTHVGAWAPRPEQIATAKLLADEAAMADHLTGFCAALEVRLDRLYRAFSAWKAEGLPVDVIAPQGAIYLSVKFDLQGRPGFPDEDTVRLWLLEEAGCAIVPFSAFGDRVNVGWVRFSVGAVSLEDIDACLARLEPALRKVMKSF
jgi:aspartate aminotransferase